jgi:hypothetical protein
MMRSPCASRASPIFVEDTVIDNAKSSDSCTEKRDTELHKVARDPRPERHGQVQDVSARFEDRASAPLNWFALLLTLSTRAHLKNQFGRVPF